MEEEIKEIVEPDTKIEEEKDFKLLKETREVLAKLEVMNKNVTESMRRYERLMAESELAGKSIHSNNLMESNEEKRKREINEKLKGTGLSI